MNKLVKSVPKKDLISEFLHSLNGILGLTERELQVMAALINFDINYEEQPNINKNVANTENRRWIIKNLGVTKDNLCRYLKRMKEKGLLKVGTAEDELTVNRALIPDIINDRIQITIVLKADD